MLTCREVVEQTDALLAGELTWRQRLSLRLHLFICRYCRRYLSQLRRLLNAIPGMHGKAERAEVERVMRKLRDDDSSKS